MFTINIYLRFALIALGILGGVALWLAYGFWYGFPFLLVGISLLIGYILLGTIMSTNVLLSQQRLDEAEKRLSLTFFPNLLLVGYKGVYHMTRGALAIQKKDLTAGETYLQMALDAGLPSDNERGAAMLQLLMVSAQRGNRNQMTARLAEIKKLNITESMLKDQIKEVEKQVKMVQNTPMNPSMMAMMGGKNGFRQAGSKRPRPRVR